MKLPLSLLFFLGVFCLNLFGHSPHNSPSCTPTIAPPTVVVAHESQVAEARRIFGSNVIIVVNRPRPPPQPQPRPYSCYRRPLTYSDNIPVYRFEVRSKEYYRNYYERIFRH